MALAEAFVVLRLKRETILCAREPMSWAKVVEYRRLGYGVAVLTPAEMQARDELLSRQVAVALGIIGMAG